MATLFGKEIRKLRIDESTTLRQMADAIEISPSYLSSIETGKRKLTVEVLEKIIGFFHLNREKEDTLRDLANKTSESISIDLSGLSQNRSESAAIFARKLNTMTDDEIDEILRVLKK